MPPSSETKNCQYISNINTPGTNFQEKRTTPQPSPSSQIYEYIYTCARMCFVYALKTGNMVAKSEIWGYVNFLSTAFSSFFVFGILRFI